MAVENRQHLGPATPNHSTDESRNILEVRMPSSQQMSVRAREKMPAHLATPQVRNSPLLSTFAIFMLLQTPVRRKTRYMSVNVPVSHQP